MDTTQSSQTEQENGHKKVGPIIATLVIVLILIIGALYIFASRMNQQTLPADITIDTTTRTVKEITNTSDDINSLNNDLNSSAGGLEGQGL